jgi:hypothetical protein
MVLKIDQFELAKIANLATELSSIFANFIVRNG